MATDNINNHLSDMNISNLSSYANNVSESSHNNDCKSWGFETEELYKLALAFYKEKEGKAIHLSYADKLKLVALTKQVSYGNFVAEKMPTVGFLDVVGNDRRQAWQILHDMSCENAMMEFIHKLDSLCSLFKRYVQAHYTEREEKDRQKREEEDRIKADKEEQEKLKQEEEEKEAEEKLKHQQLQQEMQIRAALNQQTTVQFRQYAESQFPENSEQQELLISQLQEQHYQQYIHQVYHQHLAEQQRQHQIVTMENEETPTNHSSCLTQDDLDNGTVSDVEDLDNNEDYQNSLETELLVETDKHNENELLIPNGVTSYAHDIENNEDENDENLNLPLSAASMWTRRDLIDFKNTIHSDVDSVVKVGSGETVTVRVPTHEDGTCLFWEFATDSYDLGFGVYFEWTVSPTNEVSVHVSESSDEDELDEDEGQLNSDDIEKGSETKITDNSPPTEEIIPVYRRDCHQEVYCGSHMYPGRGVYLLKFDNSYSLWRSKTLYYRVYYTK